MVVNELFYSLQGEGNLAGAPSIFIRLAGCPLRCRWCDTKYAWDPKAGQEMTCEQVLSAIHKYPTGRVVLTGGEPLIHEDVGVMCEAIRQRGYHLTVETAGVHFNEGLKADLMSISPKLSNADSEGEYETHAAERIRIEILQRLIQTYNYQLKFVIDDPRDLDEAAEVLDQLEGINLYNVFLMPQATEIKEYLEKSRWLVEYCKQTGFSFSPRLQVMLWGGQRGK